MDSVVTKAADRRASAQSMDGGADEKKFECYIEKKSRTGMWKISSANSTAPSILTATYLLFVTWMIFKLSFLTLGVIGRINLVLRVY